VLPGGVQMFFAAGLFLNSQAGASGPRQLDLVHTGGIPAQLPLFFLREPMDRGLVTLPLRSAAIFTNGDGTARIGFTGSASSPFSSSFLDYPIQILVGNVCLK